MDFAKEQASFRTTGRRQDAGVVENGLVCMVCMENGGHAEAVEFVMALISL